MRFHLVGLIHTSTTAQFVSCAYTEKTRKLSTLLTARGHEVYLYSGPENEAECAEHIPIASHEDQRKWFGEPNLNDFYPITWGPDEEHWQTTNRRAVNEIKKRWEKRDRVLITAGACQQFVADRFPGCIEHGIGYRGVLNNTFRCYESYAWMHFVQGLRNDDDGHDYDCVIPNYFDVNDFPYGDGVGVVAGKYLLFVGRFVLRKGPHIAAMIAEKAGMKLIMAGQGVRDIQKGKIIGDEVTVEGDHVTHIGPIDAQQRANLMSRAHAVIVPTTYLEPFGGVNVESQLCFPGDVEVEAPAIQQRYAHHYSGPLLTLTCYNGRTVECTPTHPFWTQRGWVPAQLLTTADRLYSYVDFQAGTIHGRRIADLAGDVPENGTPRYSASPTTEAWVDRKQGTQTQDPAILGREARIPRMSSLSRATGLSCWVHRWRRNSHTSKAESEEESQASRTALQHVSHLPTLVSDASGSSQYLFRLDQAGNWIFRPLGQWDVHLQHFRDITCSFLSSFTTVSRHQTSTDGDPARMDRPPVSLNQARSYEPTTGRFGTDDTVYEPTTITDIRSREVRNLRVFNLGTSTGTYEANGFLVHNCGTPVITTDYGAFPETVIDHVTGFRFRTLGEAVWGVSQCDGLDRPLIRSLAQSRYSMERAGEKYEAWFRRIDGLWDKDRDWYTMEHEGTSEFRRFT